MLQHGILGDGNLADLKIPYLVWTAPQETGAGFMAWAVIGLYGRRTHSGRRAISSSAAIPSFVVTHPAFFSTGNELNLVEDHDFHGLTLRRIYHSG